MTAPAPGPPLFATSITVPYHGFELELMPDGAGSCHERLDSMREQVLHVAARSRGWDSPADLDHFRRVFKLDALYHANGLALIWRDGRLVGLAGMTYDLPLDDGLILHVGSLGLLPEAQNRGFLPVMFALLWDAVTTHTRMRKHIDTDRAYLTAITQSPYILSFFARVSELYPAPGRPAPPGDVVAVARRVVARFEQDVPFDPRTFVLRNECEFFYRRIPYGHDRRINEFCDQQLRYGEGDTFMTVGRVRAAAVQRFIGRVERGHPELFAALRRGLAHARYTWTVDIGDRRQR